MSNRIGTFKVGEAFENFRVRLRKFTDKEITPTEYMRILNMNTDEFIALTGALDDEEYKDSAPLNEVTKSVSSSQDAGAAYAGGSAYVAELTIPASGSGIVWVGDTDFDVSWIGANVAIVKVSTGISYSGTIESIVSATKVNVRTIQKITAAIAGNDLLAFITANSNADEINIGVLDIYKNIERITGIFSDIHGECSMFPFTEYKGIVKPSLYPYSTYRNQIICTRAGENLFFAKGDLDSYGVRTMYFIRNPYHVTTLEDLLDIRDKNFNMVQDMNLLDGIQTLKVPMPQEMASTQQRLQAMRKAKDEELIKQLNGVS